MRVDSIEGHRIWAPAYDSSANPLLALETRLIGERLEPLSGRTFLDVASGTGRWMRHAQSRGARVLGIDLCWEMLAVAAGRRALVGRLAHADACALPVKTRTVDLALCSFALAYFPSLALALAEMARVASLVVISDLHPRAVEHGWTRSFRVAGQSYELDHQSYSESALSRSADHAGLVPLWRIEASFGEPERKIFHATGKESNFPAVCRIPAVLITAWQSR